ncbi:uncharacterized protein LOC132945875 [Metopolophium dirhodum]|uniref:uncharacterized protein LOC132945875 n=1 Tax=Metopolophium dirhodum TaxID=44670 RepID=UPI00299010A8|nr:uncharacterized protein LOC132945875 [Metopolophium dirhodum]
MATKIPQNEKLSGSRRQRPIVSRPDNFPKSIPIGRSAKKKNCLHISPCSTMMTKYWHNNYVDPLSKTRCPLKCVEVIGSHCEKVTSDAPSDGNNATGRIVNGFTWSTKDSGFSKKSNYGPIDKCQGITASVVVCKTGVTEYWFYRRGFISTIHYKETSNKTFKIQKKKTAS